MSTAPKYVSLSLEFHPPTPAAPEPGSAAPLGAAGGPADVSDSPAPSAAALPPWVLPLIMGIIDLLKLIRGKAAGLALLALLVLVMLAGDATAGPLARFRDRVQARRCGSAQQAPAVAFRGAPAAPCPGGVCPAPAVNYQFLPVGPAQVCPGGVCPLPKAGPSADAGPAADGADALHEVNALRAARGLRPYLRDPLLAEGARRLAAARAERRLFGHLPNDFALLPAGAAAAATGCAAYPPAYGWLSCAIYDGYTYAGAAWVMGADGKRYMHLVVR